MQNATVQSDGQKTTAYQKSAFTRMQRRKGKMIVSDMEQNAPREELPWSFYQYRDCTLGIFRRCVVEDNWSYLVKEGDAPQWAIDDAGLTIYSDYCTAIGGVHMAALIEQSKTISAAASKINRVAKLIHGARRVCDDRIIEALAEAGYTLQASRMENAADDEEYQQALDAIVSTLKTERTRLSAKMADRQKPGKAHKTTDEDFINTIVGIEELMKIQIDEDKTMLEKYCAYVRKLTKHIEYHNKLIRNGGRQGK